MEKLENRGDTEAIVMSLTDSCAGRVGRGRHDDLVSNEREQVEIGDVVLVLEIIVSSLYGS